MLGRRRIETSAPIRSSLANAAFAVEERVVWGGANVLRRGVDVIKWPFERMVWAIERGLVWPLEERTGRWSPSLRIGGVAMLALLAAGAGVLGLVLASGDGGGAAGVRQAATPAPAPAAVPAPQVAPATAAPVLQGAKPDFKAGADGGVASSSAEAPAPAEATAGPNSTAEVAAAGAGGGNASGAAAVKSPGPTALKVARQFSGAFVLYEVGSDPAKVREVFSETATPQVSRSLLQREPRQPAGAEVPQAKVLNVVPGPHQGETYTLSVSLLRVGVTSELRLTMQRDEKSGEWLVTDVLG